MPDTVLAQPDLDRGLAHDDVLRRRGRFGRNAIEARRKSPLLNATVRSTPCGVVNACEERQVGPRRVGISRAAPLVKEGWLQNLLSD